MRFEKEDEYDALDPARGLVSGLIISAIFWGALGLVWWFHAR